MQAGHVLAGFAAITVLAAVLTVVTPGDPAGYIPVDPDAELSPPEHGRAHIYTDAPGGIERLLKPEMETWTDGWGRDPVRVETNAAGLRDDPIPGRDGNTTRILVIGDSYTFGSGVNASDRYTELVEQELDRDVDGDVAVINAGVPGWGAPNYAAFLAERGVAYDPDIVVVALIYNDRLAHGEREALAQEAADRMAARYPDASPVETYQRRVRETVRLQMERYRERPVAGSGFAALDDIHATAEQHNVTDIYFLADTLFDADPYVERWAARQDVPLVRAPDRFTRYWSMRTAEGHLPRDPYHISRWNGDPTLQGHALLADALGDGLRPVVQSVEPK